MDTKKSYFKIGDFVHFITDPVTKTGFTGKIHNIQFNPKTKKHDYTISRKEIVKFGSSYSRGEKLYKTTKDRLTKLNPEQHGMNNGLDIKNTGNVSGVPHDDHPKLNNKLNEAHTKSELDTAEQFHRHEIEFYKNMDDTYPKNKAYHDKKIRDHTKALKAITNTRPVDISRKSLNKAKQQHKNADVEFIKFHKNMINKNDNRSTTLNAYKNLKLKLANSRLKVQQLAHKLNTEEVINESMKLIKIHTNGDNHAKVYRDSENSEYRVQFYNNGKHLKDADSFHDDKDEAHGTAQEGLKFMATSKRYNSKPKLNEAHTKKELQIAKQSHARMANFYSKDNRNLKKAKQHLQALKAAYNTTPVTTSPKSVFKADQHSHVAFSDDHYHTQFNINKKLQGRQITDKDKHISKRLRQRNSAAFSRVSKLRSKLQQNEDVITETIKLIKVHHDGVHHAKIYRDYDNKEYKVKYYNHGVYLPKADSYHDDSEDAHGTAKEELKRMNKKINEDTADKDLWQHYHSRAKETLEKIEDHLDACHKANKLMMNKNANNDDTSTKPSYWLDHNALKQMCAHLDSAHEIAVPHSENIGYSLKRILGNK